MDLFNNSPNIGPGFELAGLSIAAKPKSTGSVVEKGLAFADQAAPASGGDVTEEEEEKNKEEITAAKRRKEPPINALLSGNILSLHRREALPPDRRRCEVSSISISIY